MMIVMFDVKRATEVRMKVSREKVAENRRRILQAASRLFRERGFDAVTVAEVMKAAGLTHGGFYGYFDSKDDLVAHALADALAQSSPPKADLAQYAAGYLSPGHRDDVAGGCVTAALASETFHQASEARAAMTTGLREQIERLSRVAPGDDPAAQRRAAIGAWSAMVGALILARMGDDQALAQEVLDETRAWIADRGAAGSSAEKLRKRS
jgi:TetR/AcrR family transcriptional regulator, transcriptional repressor for nem operon